MATIDFTSKLTGAIIYGIAFYLITLILESTNIFGMIQNLPMIGLFVGVMLGAFKDKIA